MLCESWGQAPRLTPGARSEKNVKVIVRNKEYDAR